MRRRGIFFVVGLAALLGLPTVAQMQPGKITRVAAWKAKAGMDAKLEEGVKKHNEWHRKQNDAWTYNVWRITSGEGSNLYLRITPDRNWSDFDAEEEWAEADGADALVNVEPYLESATTHYYVTLPEVSRPAAGEAIPAMAEVIDFHLNMGHGSEFGYLIKKIHEGIAKTNWPVHYEWYALVNGGEHPTFVLVLPRNKWADFKEPEVSFEAMLEKAFGRAEAEMVLTKLGKAIHCERSEMVRYRPDLSYAPAKKM